MYSFQERLSEGGEAKIGRMLGGVVGHTIITLIRFVN